MSESTIVRQALRGHASEYERRAREHEERGYTMAAWIYTQEANVIRSVLRREFRETDGSMANTGTE